MGDCFHLNSCICILSGSGTLACDYKISVNGWDKLWIVDTILRWEVWLVETTRKSYIAGYTSEDEE